MKDIHFYCSLLSAESIDRLFHEERPPITTIIQQTTAIPDRFYGQKTISTPAAAEIVAAQPIALQTAMRYALMLPDVICHTYVIVIELCNLRFDNH